MRNALFVRVLGVTAMAGVIVAAACADNTILRPTTQNSVGGVDTGTVALPPATGAAVVTGVVHDFGTGRDTGLVGAIANVTVRIERMDALGNKIGAQAITTSDATGAFQFTGLPAQTFFLILKAPGYRTSEYVISTRQPTLFMSTIMTRGTD